MKQFPSQNNVLVRNQLSLFSFMITRRYVCCFWDSLQGLSRLLGEGDSKSRVFEEGSMYRGKSAFGCQREHALKHGSIKIHEGSPPYPKEKKKHLKLLFITVTRSSQPPVSTDDSHRIESSDNHVSHGWPHSHDPAQRKLIVTSSSASSR